ncbi:DUF5590 domain-containing protein [Brevibacillus sp. B_LB10_24]|uniref:cell wall elongation regulator TseB-like domain-containing protein n=1 Tax=Brevibacillus sp. B_LB10_24 TaxID=3380645 RepID=UPI0038BD1D69
MLARILISIFGFFIVIAAAVYFFVSSVVNQQYTFEDQARQWAGQRTHIAQIDQIAEYRGKQAYAVVMGKDADGKGLVAWMTPDETIVDSTDGMVAEEDVKQIALSAFPNGEIIHAVPGIDGYLRFWEILVIDQGGLYNYAYYDLHTGKLIKSYRLNQSTIS